MQAIGTAPTPKMWQVDSSAEAIMVERCKHRDPEAFARFVDSYQGRVYGFVRRMLRDSEEASDVAQEVFIKAYQAFDRFDGRSSLRTWLFRIAHNLCIDKMRRTERHIKADSLETDDEFGTVEVMDDRWQPERIVMNEELTMIVEQGLASMSDKLRSVLILHDREDMAYDEIASALELPVGTVKSRLFLARAHLQKHVGAYLEATL